MLNIITHGTATDKPALLIAHGLFGSARNWGAIAKRLSDERRVIAVDMRNHGQSFHDPDHSYAALAGDLAEVIETQAGGRADVLGHSMGGKAAMVLALKHPGTLRALTVADIAPVAYTHTQQPYIDVMRSLDLTAIDSRGAAREALAAQVDDPALAAFFTQSLDLGEKRWLLGLDALSVNMDHILGFPEMGDARFDGPALFLSGATSDYVQRAHRERIKALFPAARFASIPGAGHWLHAEKPREFEAAIRTWLAAQDAG
ncbi:alpha/beta fold hydrolase [Rhodobacteraceae bacterium 63075]|nr:alpha/beta fold hydrolase [Rhodobacteraceae bacterium 63075]